MVPRSHLRTVPRETPNLIKGTSPLRYVPFALKREPRMNADNMAEETRSCVNTLSGKLEGVFCLKSAQQVNQGFTYRTNFKHHRRWELGIPGL
jgi:hypothetical protein